MAEFDAAGDIALGGLLGRAVEPLAGERHGDHAHGEICLNCGTALVGSHCHRCGQEGHVHRSLGAIGHEILHGVVHFEGKLWRTLPLLAWRPGELTRRYIEGERARFVSPMALFLFSVFSMFALFSVLGVSPPANLHGQAEIQAGAERLIESARENRAEAVKALEAAPEGSEAAQELAERVAELDTTIAGIERTMPEVETSGWSITTLHTGWKRLDKGIEKANANPSLALYKFQTTSYKFSWLLIPLSVPFVWLLFCWKREYHAYDHMVFVTYSLSFMTLMFIALTLLGALNVDDGIISLIGIALPVWHIYRQLKGAYRLRRFSAILRTFVLINMIGVILGLFVAVLLLLGLVG